jgi:type I restriction enzyme, S subunit
MAGKWHSVRLGELCDEERGITYGIVKVGEFIPGGVPVVRGGDIRDGRIICDDSKRVTEDVSNQFRRTILRGGEIVLNLIADPGHSAIVPPELAGHNVSRDVAVIPLNGNPDVRFIDFFLKSKIAVDWLTARLQGSVTQKINLGTLRELPVPQPPLAEQKAIAAVLGALDDKIELNRRMNATLEAMARALFQSWFVDFGPVRAKLDGREPVGLDTDTAALFPKHFEESALGPIPQGWEVGSLEDVLTLQRGFDLPTPDRTHGKYPVMAASGPNGCHDKFMVRGPGVTTGRSGVLGRVFFIHGDFWPLNTSLWVKEFKRVSTAYAFHLMRSLGFEMFNAGSAVPTLNRNHVHRLPVVIPPKPIIEAFDSQVMPLMKRQKANEDQSRTLATLRDTLLPKLFSGELSGHCATN